MNASDVPVLPPVYSTIVSPGFNRPSSSARETIACAERSFILPVGFSHSSLAKTLPQSGGTTLRSCTNDVLPIACRMLQLLLMLITGHSLGGWEVDRRQIGTTFNRF